MFKVLEIGEWVSIISFSCLTHVNDKVKSGVCILATGRALFEHLKCLEKNLMD